MKKIISIFAAVCAAVFFLASCGGVKVENPAALRAAVISSEDSVSAKNVYSLLCDSSVATLTADRLNAAELQNISGYDLIYVDKSVAALTDFNAAAVEEFVQNGGSVFLDNETYSVFDSGFIGAEDFAPVQGCPVDMLYHDCPDKITEKIQTLIWDFCDIYKSYTNYESLLEGNDYGVGVIPSTAQCITSKDGLGIYTLNQYGGGYVFFTNPLLPNTFSVNNLSPRDTGAPLAAATVSANKLLRDYFAEFVSLKKCGYAVETVTGSFARPAAAWSVSIEDAEGIADGAARSFEEMCSLYGQIPSFNLVRSPYTPLRRGETVTYTMGGDAGFVVDAYENAYSSGTHFISDGGLLLLDCDDGTAGYFDDNSGFTKRAYPCAVDYNNDGIMDLICGGADGFLYYFEGTGGNSNFEFAAKTVFTDSEGNPVSVGAYSSPCIADIDGDGVKELLCGSEGGLIYRFNIQDALVLENAGVIIETGLPDAMPSAGDLNGDGITDIAVGSRGGELRVYYGDMGIYGTEFNEYEQLDSRTGWCAPCIADVNRDGETELYAGTAEGYIAVFESNSVAGYIDGAERNYTGNYNLKFGNNCVPVFYDINHDDYVDLITGLYEYGLAIPIDSEYFPLRDALQSQLDYFTEHGIYVGADVFSHEHADAAHDDKELRYHRRAFEAYGLAFEENGAKQHTWRTSKIGYDMNYDNPQGYDGTYAREFDAGLYWNSGSVTPDSGALPYVSAESAVTVPFYLDNGQLMLEPSHTPNGINRYTYINAKYEQPLLFYDSTVNLKSSEEAEQKIKKAGDVTDNCGYSFAGENQLAKMAAAALNTRVNASWENDTLYLSADVRNDDFPLFDKNYQKAVGVKIIFPDELIADEFSVESSVSYKKNNCVYTSLDKGAKISKIGQNNDLNITAVNLPADINKTEKGATVKFRDGGMMTVTVKGSVRTTSKGWDVTKQDGFTYFRKYGKADTLKIER